MITSQQNGTLIKLKEDIGRLYHENTLLKGDNVSQLIFMDYFLLLE